MMTMFVHIKHTTEFDAGSAQFPLFITIIHNVNFTSYQVHWQTHPNENMLTDQIQETKAHM